jgi:hypothetical protein
MGYVLYSNHRNGQDRITTRTARRTPRSAAAALSPMNLDAILNRRSCSPSEAAAYVGGRQLLLDYKEAGWLKPYVQRNRLTRYDRQDLDRCIDRHKAEGDPFPKRQGQPAAYAADMPDRSRSGHRSQHGIRSKYSEFMSNSAALDTDERTNT